GTASNPGEPKPRPAADRHADQYFPSAAARRTARVARPPALATGHKQMQCATTWEPRSHPPRGDMAHCTTERGGAKARNGVSFRAWCAARALAESRPSLGGPRTELSAK